jgi:hypothetical protein
VFALEHWSAHESVRIAWWISTGLPGFISGPEELAAANTLLAAEPFVCEEVQSIFVFGEHVDQLGWEKDTTMLKGFLKIDPLSCDPLHNHLSPEVNAQMANQD